MRFISYIHTNLIKWIKSCDNVGLWHAFDNCIPKYAQMICSLMFLEIQIDTLR